MTERERFLSVSSIVAFFSEEALAASILAISSVIRCVAVAVINGLERGREGRSVEE